MSGIQDVWCLSKLGVSLSCAILTMYVGWVVLCKSADGYSAPDSLGQILVNLLFLPKREKKIAQVSFRK